ncbi:MAG TPA: hypothetical protein VHF27_05325 [Acidimicrobiales bacterium]|nr:hypothetical protein [Acidimicrobiales bacterium]
MFFAAMPWTYWMALPILAASVLATVAFGLVYLKRVVEPDLLRLDALEAARGTPSLSAGRALEQGRRQDRFYG